MLQAASSVKVGYYWPDFCATKFFIVGYGVTKKRRITIRARRGSLRKQRAGWALSMNGPADGDDSVPQIYDERFELQNGTSAFRRLGGL